MATFTEIYKQELKGSGVLSSLGTSAIKRTKERLDPRNMLFGGSGIIAATGQKIFGKGYQAIAKTPASKLSSKISEGGELKSEALNALLASNLKQEMQLSIIAKNTSNGNAMARDINVMRQNIMKLVTMGGGKASRSADMFFKTASMREAEYENRLKSISKTTSPTPVAQREPAKEDNKSFLSSLFGKAVSVMGLTVTALGKTLGVALGGIKTILEGLFDSFKFIKKIISGIAATEIFELFVGRGAGGLLKVVETVLSLLKSPVTIALLAGVAAAVWAYRKAEEIKNAPKEDDSLKKQMSESNRVTMMEAANIKIGDKTAKQLIAEEQNFNMLAKQNKKMLSQENLKRSQERLKSLASVGIYAPVDYTPGKQKELLFRREYKQDNMHDMPDTSPTKVEGGEARKAAESYLGRAMANEEWDALIRATYAESSRNAEEYSNVMAVILNRARKAGKSILEILTEKNQFQAVTGTEKSPGPSAMFRRGPDAASAEMIMNSATKLGSVSKDLDAFTAANRKAYKEGTSTKWLDTLLSSGGKAIGGTVFAENMYRGSSLTASSATSEDLKRIMSEAPANVNIINAPQSTTVAQAPQTQQQISSATNIDALELFFGRALVQ